jgi:hypothetical protein
MLKDYIASRPVCTYKPYQGSNAEKILNYILAHRGTSHIAVVHHFKQMGIISADGQVRAVVAGMIRHGHQDLIPSGYSDYFLQKANSQNVKKTKAQQNTVQQSDEITFEELILAKKFMSKFGGIKKFKEVCEALELLEAA